MNRPAVSLSTVVGVMLIRGVARLSISLPAAAAVADKIITSLFPLALRSRQATSSMNKKRILSAGLAVFAAVQAA